MNRFTVLLSLFLTVLLPACAGLSSNVAETPSTPVEIMETPSLAPTVEVAPTATTAASRRSFDPATYRDEKTGFQFEYPSTWTYLDAFILDEDMYQVFFEASDGNGLFYTVYRWEPKNNLEAFADYRRKTWETSIPGSKLFTQELLSLPGDHPAIGLIFNLEDEAQMFVLITDIGDRYLELAGMGDMALMQEIAMTIELTDPGQ